MKLIAYVFGICLLIALIYLVSTYSFESDAKWVHEFCLVESHTIQEYEDCMFLYDGE
jgi:hypothetical protein